ncbi:MAG: hypothetical protein H8D34_27800, partial [Chloroflexi bacterium]|nr:hypothetical protein [Chloroflexota bacterium]
MVEYNRDPLNFERRLSQVQHILPDDLRNPAVLDLIKMSLVEDLFPEVDSIPTGFRLSNGDVTSVATIMPDTELEGKISA